MPEKRKVWHWLVLILLSIIWGTSYILMKKGLESFSILEIATLRILIAFVCLLPTAIKSLPKLSRENLHSVLIVAFCGSGFPALLFPLAQTKIDSSLAGLLNTLSPVFTLIIGIFFYRKMAVRSQIAGVFLGLLGAAGLLYSDEFTFNFYGLFVVLATLLYGFSANEVSKIKGINGLQITSLAFFVLGPFAMAMLLFTDFQAAMSTPNWIRNFSFIAILAIIGSAVALALFYLLIRDTSPIFASLTTYFIPIVATLWGVADNEKLKSSMLISVILILGGVYLINRPGFLHNLRKMVR